MVLKSKVGVVRWLLTFGEVSEDAYQTAAWRREQPDCCGGSTLHPLHTAGPPKLEPDTVLANSERRCSPFYRLGESVCVSPSDKTHKQSGASREQCQDLNLS